MWSLTIAVGYREGLNRELPIAHGYRESNMWSLTIRAYVVVGQQEGLNRGLPIASGYRESGVPLSGLAFGRDGIAE